MGLGLRRGGSSGRETLHSELGWSTGEVRASGRPWDTAARCHGAGWSVQSPCLVRVEAPLQAWFSSPGWAWPLELCGALLSAPRPRRS